MSEPTTLPSTEGVKQSNGKLNYSEIDWNYIARLAFRMNQNKVKYEKKNWQLPIPLEEIEQAMLRHIIAILNPNVADEETRADHLAAIGCNAMILNYHI